ncbi:MAG: hypothetical protein EAX91_07075 [Candidatus Lokiarchaeota archaeon]|nr:hypothetical protein [Candidatus Lokiarchaeota archaeon]
MGKGRLLPPRPNKKVKNKIGGGGRNECVEHTTKRQKSRAGQESWFYLIPYFIIIKIVICCFKIFIFNDYYIEYTFKFLSYDINSLRSI